MTNNLFKQNTNMRTKFLSGVAIMTLLASCETITFDYENEVDLKTPDGTFSAIIERQPVTRTTLSDNTNSSGYYTLSWNQGDEISIYDGENISVFTTDDNGTDTGIFRKKEGTVNYGAFSYTAFYPSSITATDMMLPAEQYYVEDNVKDFPHVCQIILKRAGVQEPLRNHTSGTKKPRNGFHRDCQHQSLL